MSFPLNLYVLAFAGAGVTTLLAVPWWRAWCRRAGLLDEPGHRKTHDKSIPLAGGLAIVTGLLLPLGAAWVARRLGWFDEPTNERMTYGFQKRSLQLIGLLGGALAMTFLGWLDDRVELRARAKFAGQLAIALLVAAVGIRITLFVPSVLLSYALTVGWILAVTNAFNFTDNMNGLCAGLAGTASLLLGLHSARHDYYLVASLAFLVGGATFGFLPYNFPRASVFLGDAGSHLLGFLLAVLTILPHFHSPRHPNPWAVFSPLLILAVPLADLLWVICLRLKAGQPVYVGDENHFSHHLVRRGLGKAQAVVLLWAIGLGAGILTFLF